MKVKPEDGSPIPTKGPHHNYRKLFDENFKQLTLKHNAWQVWQDFVTLSAISISNAIDKREQVWQHREDEYMGIIKRYSKEELELMAKLLGYTTLALETNPCQDFLGQLYMDLDFGRGWNGQFFTPWHIAEMMSKMQIDTDIFEKVKDGGYITVSDPCCGAGVMLLAFAQVCKEDYKVNFQRSVLFVAQDIDPIVAKMCYIQMSLMGLPGYVAIGDSLSNPISGTDLNPVFKNDDLWFTPLLYTNIWMYRRLFAGDENIEFNPSRGSGKSMIETSMLFDGIENNAPREKKVLKTSPDDIKMANEELSKLEKQKKSVKRFINKEKEQFRNEIKRKNHKKDS